MYTLFIIYLLFAVCLLGVLFSKKFRLIFAKIIVGAVLFALFFLVGWSL